MNISRKGHPSARCVCCERSLEDFGGERIVAQQPRGYVLLDEPRVSWKNDPQYNNIKVDESPRYLCVWGEIWHLKAIQDAIDSINDGQQPWFCQACGKRLCSICGYPVNRPMGSDILMADGSALHCAIMPFNPGCCNSKCSNHREK